MLNYFDFCIIILFLIWFVLGLLVIWCLGLTEFSYLNKNYLKGLYNFFAFGYERKWKNKKYTSLEITQKLFLQPLEKALQNKTEAKVLDLACGTGRMSLMLLQENWFKGKIWAWDFSEGMLFQFKKSLSKLTESLQNRILITQKDLTNLPSEGIEKQFEVIMLMEAGEFLPNFPDIIKKASLSLKSGGLFLLTKPPEYIAWTYWKRKQSKKQIIELLENCGFAKIEIQNWTSRYEVISAWKA